MRARAAWLTAAGGLAMGASCVVAGVGFALTPASGGSGERFGAFGDPWVEPALAAAGIAGGALLGACAVWLALRLRDGDRPGSAFGWGGAATLGYTAVAKAGLWLFGRADPPLPPSWGWIRLALAGGLIGAATWVAGVFLALRRAPERPA